jgi:hypothetical protein
MLKSWLTVGAQLLSLHQTSVQTFRCYHPCNCQVIDQILISEFSPLDDSCVSEHPDEVVELRLLLSSLEPSELSAEDKPDTDDPSEDILSERFLFADLSLVARVATTEPEGWTSVVHAGSSNMSA